MSEATTAIPLAASFVTFGFVYLITGGIVLRLYHAVGDARRFAQAQRLQLQG